MGWSGASLRILESTLLPVVMLCIGLYLCLGFFSGPEEWADYFDLFYKSRAVHASALDFLVLNACMPFWVANDAAVRGWDVPRPLLWGLALIPLVGPAIYLILRPKTT